jgi:hypothetical protein
MTVEQARVRLAEIRAMAARGDYSWDYDEKCRLEEMVPEEAEAVKKACNAHVKRVQGRRKKGKS